ncbi:hypothetical protein D3C76_1544080 [compost metagenome]
MHPGACRFKAFEDFQALGCLQEHAQGKTSGHDDRHDPRHPGGFQVEAIAIENDTDNRPEHNQGNETGKNRVNQAFFDIDCFMSG